MNIDFGLFRVRVVRPSALFVSLGPTMAKSFTISEGTGTMDINLGDFQFTTIHLQGLDAAGLAGKFTKPPAWAVDDPHIVTITPSADGASCRVEAATPAVLGNTNITVTDQDNPNIAPLVFNVTITAEQVTTLGATVDAPQEKTEPVVVPA